MRANCTPHERPLCGPPPWPFQLEKISSEKVGCHPPYLEMSSFYRVLDTMAHCVCLQDLCESCYSSESKHMWLMCHSVIVGCGQLAPLMLVSPFEGCYFLIWQVESCAAWGWAPWFTPYVLFFCGLAKASVRIVLIVQVFG